MQISFRMCEPNETKRNSRREKGRLDPDKIESEILANERTFLAWVRTSIAVMSLGFVVARFSLWMREVATRVNAQMPTRGSGLSAPLGECMIGAGALLTVFAAWRYHVINRTIRRGEIQADPQMVTAVTAIVVLAALAVIVYMTVSAGSG
jgi:putative membrane protein